ncbi:hypothetical protein TRVA0_004S01596 [Trichomonascus vanleenenianus]|uniref:uncharacterized protein n=1 Tax=Trichomonascus vanleenenianus TaxID=2268995 RepID=UPI003EC9B0DA
MDDSEVCTDPRGLLVQSVVKHSSSESEVKIAIGSRRISSSGELPLMLVELERSNQTAVVCSTTDAIVRRISHESRTGKSVERGEDKVYISMVESTLDDAWVLAMLDNEPVRRMVYGVDKSAPLIQRALSSELLYTLVKRLVSRYPGYAKAYESWWPRRNQAIESIIHDRAKECLDLFERRLEGYDILSEDYYLDMTLFAYVHCILRFAADSWLAKLVGPNVKAHCQRVYSQLYTA